MTDDAKGDKTVNTKLTDDPAFAEMQKTVKGIAMLVQQQAQTQATMQDNFTNALNKLTESHAQPKPKSVPLEDQEDAINDLDNIGLVKLVVGEVSKVVDQKLGTISEDLQGTKREISDGNIANEVKGLMKDNPDFMDWRSEMAEIAKENPTLSVQRIYSLAKSENPDKAADLTKKYSKDEGKKDVGFLSLMPTGGEFDDSDEKPTKEQALEKGWEDAVAQFPTLANIGDG